MRSGCRAMPSEATRAFEAAAGMNLIRQQKCNPACRHVKRDRRRCNNS
jgi:hypothetical protein